jgi:hypothetical protein
MSTQLPWPPTIFATRSRGLSEKGGELERSAYTLQSRRARTAMGSFHK